MIAMIALRSGLMPALTLALLALLGGCAASPTIEGAELERLQDDIRGARPALVRVNDLRPLRYVDGGPPAIVVMPYRRLEKKVSDFALYDGYWKVVFTIIDELRALGWPADADPALWAARANARARSFQGQDDIAIQHQLVQLGAHDEVEELWRLSPEKRRSMAVSLTVLYAARSGLPLTARGVRVAGAEAVPSLGGATPGGITRSAMPRPKGVTAREIRERYFAPDEGAAPSTLWIEVQSLECTAWDEVLTGGRRAKAALRLRLDAGGAARFDRAYTIALEASGSGVRIEKGGSRNELSLGPDDPLEAAIRGIVRAFARDALASGAIPTP